MTFFVQAFFSALIVIFVIIYPPKYGGDNSTPITMKILNPTDAPVALCWLSTYARENELVANAPEGCYRVGVGTKNIFTLQTFTGHRFIILPWDKEESVTEASTSGSVTTNSKTNSVPTIFLYVKPELTFYEVEFKSSMASLKDIKSMDDLWQQLLRHRHYFMLFVVSLYLLSLQFTPSSSSSQSRKSNARQQNIMNSKTKTSEVNISETNTIMIPRHSVKAFAVLNMIVNHMSYLLFKERPAWQLVGTVPADLIGSAQVFWFLVGLHENSSRPKSVRSESSTLIVMFVLLEHFCRLPKPLTFETLFTVVVARSILSGDLFEYNENKKCCAFSELPIWMHSLCCCALISANRLFNANGLRLLQCTGLLYAITGRLFLSNHSSAPLTTRAAHYLWLLAAWGLQFRTVYVSKLYDLDLHKPQTIIVCVCLLGAILQAVLFARPVKQAWWEASRVEVWISRYSLEIYCAHFVVLWFYFGV